MVTLSFMRAGACLPCSCPSPRVWKTTKHTVSIYIYLLNKLSVKLWGFFILKNLTSDFSFINEKNWMPASNLHSYRAIATPLKWTLSLPINHIAHRAYFTNIYWAFTICQVCFKVFHTISSPKTKPYKIGSYYNNLTNKETEAYITYTTCLRSQNQQVTKPRFKPRQMTSRCLSTPYLGIWADNFQSICSSWVISSCLRGLNTNINQQLQNWLYFINFKVHTFPQLISPIRICITIDSSTLQLLWQSCHCLGVCKLYWYFRWHD